MIEFKNVTKAYSRDMLILNNVSFKINAGEFVFVSGPSGAGKSTLLKVIGGLDKASGGEVIVNGQDLGRLPELAKPYLRRAVGVILQDIHLLQDRTAFDNVLLPLLVTGHSPEHAAARVKAAMIKVGLAGKEKFYPQELSGGNQQRLAIARAIVNRPAILIADEPTASLDRFSAERIIEVFKEFNHAGVTTLIATHDETLIARYATKVLHIEYGKLTVRVL